MIRFILNDKEIVTGLHPGITLLDFIRYNQHLVGTKIGCREGDCGACTILTGEIKDGNLVYSSATSCLMPLANAHGKHIVTIEGINLDGLNAVQQAFADEGATQCGFCTPGFIVSLTGFCLGEQQPVYADAINAMNGNICRCTGYKSIERAAAVISKKMQERNGHDAIRFAIENNVIPAYFTGIKERLDKIIDSGIDKAAPGNQSRFLSGGTDLYVQMHDSIAEEPLVFMFDNPALKGIAQEGNSCILGASVTVSDIAGSGIFKNHFPGLENYIKLVSSTQIRNMATLAGNFANASPIGDMTIFFLALDASLQLNSGNDKRTIKLCDFYKGYKQLDRKAGEFIEKIVFDLPKPDDHFNFEKVCKRTHLDIASVNTAICLRMNGGIIEKAGLSAGGVGPVPLFLSGCSHFLAGKKPSWELVLELVELAQHEISPISDTRGSDAYKRLLLSQLIKAHFIRLFPSLQPEGLVNT